MQPARAKCSTKIWYWDIWGQYAIAAIDEAEHIVRTRHLLKCLDGCKAEGNIVIWSWEVNLLQLATLSS